MIGFEVRQLELWILSYLLNSIWQVPLFFATGWLAARALKRVGPTAEHRVWVGVLLAQALVPAWSTLPPDWTQVLFAWAGATYRTTQTGVSVAIGPGTAANGLRLPSAVFASIAIAWGLVTAFFAIRFLRRCRALSLLSREASELVLEGDSAEDWAQCAIRFGIRDVTLASSSRIFAPVTTGLIRKLVLLPAHMVSRLPAADLRTVFAHEFAHLRRQDFRKNLIYELLSLPVSYHPLLGLTRERIMESREMVCDQIAARVAGRNEYARSLLRLASLLVNGTPIRTPIAIGILDANAFERRFMRLTGKQNDLGGARRFVVVAACFVFGVAICGSALAMRMRVDAASAASDSNPPAQQVKVPAKIMQDNVLHKFPPVYPEDAKKARIQGTVRLDAIIGRDGSVEHLAVVSGPKELQQSALDAVRQWTYKPYLLNGNPVEVETTITVIYSLRK